MIETKVRKIRRHNDTLLGKIQEKESELEELREQQLAVQGRLTIAQTKVDDIRRALGYLGERAPVTQSLPPLLSPSAVDHIIAAFDQHCAKELSEGAFRMALAQAEQSASAGIPAEGQTGEDSHQEDFEPHLDDLYPPACVPPSQMETEHSRRCALSDHGATPERNTRVRASGG